MRAIPPVCALLALPLAAQLPDDLRAAYDVEAYHLDLRVRPAAKELEGSVRMTAATTAPGLQIVELDLVDSLEVMGVLLADQELEIEMRIAPLIIRKILEMILTF